MKKFVYILALIFCGSAFGQLSKEQEKAVQSQMKAITPEQFLENQREFEKSKKAIKDLEAQVEQLNAENDALNTEIIEYESSIKAKKQSLVELEKMRSEAEVAMARYYKTTAAYNAPVGGSDLSSGKTNTKSTTPQSGGYAAYKKLKEVPGLVYKVQIGAYKGYDLREYFNRHENNSMSLDEDGMMRYTLGVFTDYWKADQFKGYLRKMGVKGAWVVAYKDDKRVSIKDAREGNL